MLVQDKNKLSLLPPALLFEVCSTDDGHFNLEWRGETDLTIADLENTKGRPKLEAAEKFLREKLADGPKEVNWLIEQAKGVCSKRTLDEAKKNLQIANQRKGKGKNHSVSWALPTVEEPEEAPDEGYDQGEKASGQDAAHEAGRNRPAKSRRARLRGRSPRRCMCRNPRSTRSSRQPPRAR